MKTRLLIFLLCMMLAVSCEKTPQPSGEKNTDNTEQPDNSQKNDDEENSDDVVTPDDEELPGDKENPDDVVTPGDKEKPEDIEQPEDIEKPGGNEQPEVPDPIDPDKPKWNPNPQDPEGNIHTFTLASRLYYGDAPVGMAQYYVIRYDGDELWQTCNYFITGFDYEQGYEYYLKAELVELEQPIMDWGNKEYKVIEVISKEKKDSENLPF